MIKVTCNRGNLEVKLEGNGIDIISELCVIVDSVCDSFSKDKEFSTDCKNYMITAVARGLMKKVHASRKVDK